MNKNINKNIFYSIKQNFISYDNIYKDLSRKTTAIYLLEDNLDKISWDNLSENPNAIHLLEKNPKNINLNYLSKNSNVKAIDLINDNLDKIKEKYNLLQYNPNVLSIILKWDYHAIKTHFYTSYGKELIEWIYNPKNMNKWDNTCWDLEIM
jgi:hypothetical protein